MWPYVGPILTIGLVFALLLFTIFYLAATAGNNPPPR